MGGCLKCAARGAAERRRSRETVHMSLPARARSRRTPRVLIGASVLLLLVAFIAALWPRAVTYDGVRRSCSPQIGDFVPSDPGPGYPLGLDIECSHRSRPERLTMTACGALGALIGGVGLWLHQRRRPVSRWTPPPNWPVPPTGWWPHAGWAPPPEWPQPPPDWQWWQSSS